jgi:hypothetical protein
MSKSSFSFDTMKLDASLRWHDGLEIWGDSAKSESTQLLIMPGLDPGIFLPLQQRGLPGQAGQ